MIFLTATITYDSTVSSNGSLGKETQNGDSPKKTPEGSSEACNGPKGTTSSPENKGHEQDVNSFAREQNLQNLEVEAPGQESQKSLNFRFATSESDETDDENRVFNEGLNTIEGQTSVAEDSAPDESSQDWNQDKPKANSQPDPTKGIIGNPMNATIEALVGTGEKSSKQTPSKKRPLSLTQDTASKHFHKPKRHRSRIDIIKTAINEDHPHAHVTSESVQVRDDKKTSLKGIFADEKEMVISETDDEEVKSGLPDFEDFGLEEEDLDYWKEHAKRSKPSTSNQCTKGKKATASSLPPTLMQQGNDVQLKENAENSVRASAKGKSLKTSTKQATRKQLLESQKSQSSQDIVTSSQSQPNSDDEFKPRRTKRNTQKKSYK